jgi:hydrogenase/urease accessory protein HupE
MPKVVREGSGMVASWEIVCPSGVVGKTVGVEGIATSQADVLLRVALTDGRSFRRVLTPDQPSFLVPKTESKLGVVRGYAVLGIEHILTGWDHLLFVLGLILLVGYGRTLLWTITAFTGGHSVTLALATLGVVNVPPAPIEAAIALSIYLLAVELMRSRAGRTTFMQRAPWLVAGAFGLLHGLGFAGALAQVGLPRGEIPLALFAFNVGIELGQLAFVAVVLGVMTLVRRIPLPQPAWGTALASYAIGSLAIYWFLERIAARWG